MIVKELFLLTLLISGVFQVTPSTIRRGRIFRLLKDFWGYPPSEEMPGPPTHQNLPVLESQEGIPGLISQEGIPKDHYLGYQKKAIRKDHYLGYQPVVVIEDVNKDDGNNPKDKPVISGAPTHQNLPVLVSQDAIPKDQYLGYEQRGIRKDHYLGYQPVPVAEVIEVADEEDENSPEEKPVLSGAPTHQNLPVLIEDDVDGKPNEFYDYNVQDESPIHNPPFIWSKYLH